MTGKPSPSEFHPYYQGYIDLVEGNVLNELGRIGRETVSFFESIPEEKLDWAYAPGKWTIKSLLQHMMDVERVMAYRALCAARNDKTALPGFDHDEYGETVDCSEMRIQDMLDLYRQQRLSTILLFRSFSEEEMTRLGNANGAPISPRALAYIICGHDLHHVGVISERYLS